MKEKKVAIIGAGLSGISCAHELELHGIRPVIFERNSFIGDQITHCSALLEIVGRPIKDLLRYMDKKYNLEIKPLNTVNTLTHHSPGKTTAIYGNLGYFFNRSADADSLFCQLFKQLKNSELVLSTVPDPEKLSKEFDHVVIANGNPIYSDMLGCWQSWLNTYLRGAIVLGDFNPNELIVWIDKTISKRGYAYLTPLSSKRASIILIVTDVDDLEIEHYWDLFWAKENLKYTIVEEYKLEHKSGYVYPLIVGNKIFAGNAGGAIDPFLGFGQFNSITMGIMAARSIALNKDYSKLVEPMNKKNIEMLYLRKAFDRLDNAQYGMLLTFMQLPGVKHLTYYSPLNAFKLGATLAKLLPQRLE